MRESGSLRVRDGRVIQRELLVGELLGRRVGSAVGVGGGGDAILPIAYLIELNMLI